jgi:pyruvate dehydrogenase (quinone)
MPEPQMLIPFSRQKSDTKTGDLVDEETPREAAPLLWSARRVERAGRQARGSLAWDEALAAGRPVVYEAIVDAEVPPMPPHIFFDQPSP